MSLKEQVMVVNLSISQWTARKFDAKVSREVETQYQANDAGRYNKLLIAAENLKAIQKIAGSIRTYHYFNTLPWGDNGDRILPTANYFQYVTEMGRMKREFETQVIEFIGQYPALKADAVNRLKNMFNEADYPSPGAIQDKFNVRFSFMPVTDAEDLRVNISDDEINRIRGEIQGEITGRVQNSITELIVRVKDAVSHMAESLGDQNKIFRDSLVGNVCSLIEVVPLLNFTNDSHVNDLVNMIRPLCVNPEDLRNNAEFRKEIAERAATVLALI